MSLISSFNKSFQQDSATSGTLLDILSFSRQWCMIEPSLAQCVALKIYADEPLSTIVQPRYEISEQEWFDEMYEKGYFPPNVYERIEENRGLGFENILLVCGRGAGKSTLIAIAALYTIYKVLMHHNPQAYYNIQEFEVIEVAVTATTEQNTLNSPFKKIENICKLAISEGSPLSDWIDHNGLEAKTIYFKTGRDKEADDLIKKKKSREIRNASVRIRAYNSNADSFRGGSVIAVIFDEFGQFKITNQGEDYGAYFFDTLTARLPQFKGDGRAFILSTPQGKIGKFYELYQEVWEGTTTSTIGMKMPTWTAWEHEPPERRMFTLQSLSKNDSIPFSWKEDETAEEAIERAPASFKKEFGAEFEGMEEQWIPSFYLVTDEKERGIFRSRLDHITRGSIGTLYSVHVDPGRFHDAFAIVITHKEVHDGYEIVVIDQAIRWFVAPHPNYREQKYETVFRQKGAEPAFINTEVPMKYLKNQILDRFNVAMMTFDQFQSAHFVDQLALYAQRKRMNTIIKTVPATQKHNREVADTFEQLVLEERLWCYPHPILQHELTNLIKDEKGRVEAAAGAHDDLFDAASNSSFNCLDLPDAVGGGVSGFRGRSFSLTPTFPQTRV